MFGVLAFLDHLAICWLIDDFYQMIYE